MPELITCPSGLSGTIRGLKVRDEDALIAKGVGDPTKALDNLLQNCWQETKNPGVYEDFKGGLDPETGLIRPLGMLQGDRVYLLVALRKQSYGDQFDFTVNCSNTLCGKTIGWGLQLSKLPIQPLSDVSRDLLIKGNRFPLDLPGCKKKAFIRLLTGREEHKMARIREQNGNENMSSTVLRMKLVEVEGIKENQLIDFVLDMEGIDARAIRQMGEEIDCGVDTSLDITCQKCKTMQTVELPLGENFLGTGGRKKKS